MVKKMHASTSPSTAVPSSKSGRKSGKSAGKASPSVAAGLQDSALAKSVKESAQHIWLAGMGAFSKAQEEGTKVFEALVKEGQSLQRKTQAVAEEKIGEVTGKMTAMAGTVQAKANQNWDKLEGIFEARTAKAMNKLGVPTAKDVESLIQRVDELAAAVAKLSRQVSGEGKGTSKGKTTAAAEAEPMAKTRAARAPRTPRAARPVATRRKAEAAAPAATVKAAAPAAKKGAAKRTRKAAATAAAA